MPRAPDALQQARDRARRAELAHQVDIADIDAELERCGRDQRFQRTGFQPLFGVETLLLGEAAVMRGHPLGAEPFRQLPRHPLGKAAGIDEDQGRAMRFDQLGQPVVNLLPDFAGHHGFERRGGNFEGEVARPAMAGVDDPALGIGPDEKSGHRLDRLLRRREADAQQTAAAQRGQPLERDCQMRAALVRRQRMDLVDDDRPRRRQHFAAGFGAEQDVERLRRGHDDVRRKPAHALPLSGRRVASAHPGADFQVRQPSPLQGLADAGERDFEIALNVVGQRLQRRDVDDLRLVREAAVHALANQGVDRREKGGERLSGPGRCGDQGMPAGLDRWPRLGLRSGRRRKAAVEPLGDCGMEKMGRVHASSAYLVKSGSCWSAQLSPNQAKLSINMVSPSGFEPETY